MIKGTSKIQIFNAKTGELEHEQTNTNLVTRAVQDLINDNDPLGLGKLTNVYTSSSATYYAKSFRKLSYLTPLDKVAFGGILLWDNTIDEDPNITMPPDGVHNVGHAGDTYSGANKYRGTYNANESGAIENGYRHVWDFATDKANGTIKCISLTSKNGGICGYKNDENSNNELKPPYSYFDFGSDKSYISLNTNYNYIDFDNNGADNGAFLYLSADENGTFYGLKRSTNDYTKIQKITFADPSAVTLNKLPSRITAVEDLITGINKNAYTYVYDNKIHEIYRSAASEITHKTYELDGSAADTVTVTPPQPIYGNYSTNGFGTTVFYYNGNYYYVSAVDSSKKETIIRKCSADGSDLGDIRLVHNTNYVYHPNMFFVDNSGAGVLGLNYGSNNGQIKNIKTLLYIYPDDTFCLCQDDIPGYLDADYKNYIPAVTPFKSPFVYVSVGNAAARLLLCVDCRYLATINNLSEEIVKTSEQTMKITYEITEEE